MKEPKNDKKTLLPDEVGVFFDIIDENSGGYYAKFIHVNRFL